MINQEDYFYAFFSGIISFLAGFLLVFLIYPEYFQNKPSILAIGIVVTMEIVIFFLLFFLMRHKKS
jgi:uncharacterized membrane protein